MRNGWKQARGERARARTRSGGEREESESGAGPNRKSGIYTGVLDVFTGSAWGARISSSHLPLTTPRARSRRYRSGRLERIRGRSRPAAASGLRHGRFLVGGGRQRGERERR